MVGIESEKPLEIHTEGRVCTHNMSGRGNTTAIGSRFRGNDGLSCANHSLTTFACTRQVRHLVRSYGICYTTFRWCLKEYI
jgi:hypothetical protein